MNFSPGRSAQFIIAGCVLLLFFLYVAWPGDYFFLNDDFIHVPLAGSGSLFNRSFIRPVSDITLYLDHLLWSKKCGGLSSYQYFTAFTEFGVPVCAGRKTVPQVFSC